MRAETRARVFVSCGQQKSSSEEQVADAIRLKLEEMGFDPYVAVREQSLRGVKENIFKRLAEAEYFLFVDFKRERLGNLAGEFRDLKVHRGSVFSHQELALATFLGIECLAFQEEGVKKDDGILRFIQANCIPFSDRHLLADVVAQRVKDKWDPAWRNELTLSRDDPKQYVFVDEVAEKPNPSRWYHIRVSNHHRSETARNCLVHLESVKTLATGTVKTHDPIEFKWQGVKTQTVSIPAGQSRHFDAFHIFHVLPKSVYLGVNLYLVDYTGYVEVLHSPADCELSFVVFSDNFAPARKSFVLRMGQVLDDIDLR